MYSVMDLMRSISVCVQGVRLELCTRTFRENGLLAAQAEVSTKGDVASNVF
jgi:hypothetical protein